MERHEIECWFDSMDRKINGLDRPEEEDFFQAIKCLESLLDEKTYDDGKEEGHGEGYNEGYDEGNEKGYEDGFRDGKLIGLVLISRKNIDRSEYE